MAVGYVVVGEKEKGNDWLPILESHACYWEPICSSSLPHRRHSFLLRDLSCRRSYTVFFSARLLSLPFARAQEMKVKPVYARMIPDRHRMTLRNTRPVWKISWASFLLQQIDPPTIKHLSSTVDQSEKEEMDVLPVTPSRLLE